jgi:hypothetical protein
MKRKTPNKLFVGLLKTKLGEEGWGDVSKSVQVEHTRYMIDLIPIVSGDKNLSS